MDGERIIEQLYRSRSGALARSVARSMGSRDAANDSIQTMFVRFIDRIRSSPIDAPAAYLQRMAANEQVSAARRDRRDREVLDRLAEAEPHYVDAVRQLEARDLLRRIEVALSRLKPRTRDIFLAHRIEGLSYGEIGARHGLSVKGVEKQMSKAIAYLDRWLERNGE